ncbi:epoxyqueuosine reductase [Halanaerocella petrolearia]
MELTNQVITFAKDQGVDLVGIVDVKEIDFPKDHRPSDYLPEAKSAISIGYRLNKGSVLNLPKARNGYMLEFNTANEQLNLINHQVSRFLEEKGYLTFGVPGTASIGDGKRLKADLSHKHLAVAAGLGKFGINNLVLTPEFGPRVRFSTIITTAKLEATVSEAEKLCTDCQLCVEICPANALDDWKDNYSPQEGWRINKEACYHQIFVKLGGKRCGLCIKACPFTKNN